MKRLIIWAGASPFLLVAALVTWGRLSPTPVKVTVANWSSQDISSVLLRHPQGVALAKRIPTGEQRTLEFYPPGETVYMLEVRFADGSCIEGNGGYAEPGYEFRETVYKSGVRHELVYF
jgi:hypothetical protein